MKQADREKQEAREQLKEIIGDTRTIYTKLNHVSRSGMYRVIDVFIIQDNKPLRISWSVAKAIGNKYDRRHEGVGIGGCGMDMGFAIVYNLSMALFCPDKYDHESAYTLKQEWI